MSYLRNDMLEYPLQWGDGLGDNFSGPFGGSTNNSGFGGGGFGKGFTGGLGQSRGIHAYGTQGYPAAFVRQDSALGQMTRTKDEQSKPLLFPNLPYPYGQYYMSGEIGSLFTGSNVKNSVKKRPGLMRQYSFSLPDDSEFIDTSDPSTDTEVRPCSNPYARSSSISDSITEPMNMDIAQAVCKRQMSLNIDRPKKRPSLLTRANTLFHVSHSLRRKKSEKRYQSKTDIDSSQNHELLPESSSPSSKENKIGIHGSAEGQNSKSPNSNRKGPQPNSQHDPEHEQLIMSLMNTNQTTERCNEEDIPSPKDVKRNGIGQRISTVNSMRRQNSQQSPMRNCISPLHVPKTNNEKPSTGFIYPKIPTKNVTAESSNVNEITLSSIIIPDRHNSEEDKLSSGLCHRSTDSIHKKSTRDNKHKREHEWLSVQCGLHDTEHKNVMLTSMNPEKTGNIDPGTYSEKSHVLEPITFKKEVSKVHSLSAEDLENEHSISGEPFESPTLVGKRIHKLTKQDSDNDVFELECPGTIYSLPLKPVTSIRPPAYSPALNKRHEMIPNAKGQDAALRNVSGDSNTSEMFYDCVSNYMEPMENEEVTCNTDTKELLESGLTSIHTNANPCVDLENISTENNLIHGTFSSILTNFPPGHTSNKHVHYEDSNSDKSWSNENSESDTSEVKHQPHISVHTQQNKYSATDFFRHAKQRASLERLNYSFSQTVHEEEHDNAIELIYESLLTVPEGHEDYQTPESSESGYETCNILMSPKNDDSRVMQFVNSLPINLDVDESNFIDTCGNFDSETDSDFNRDNAKTGICNLDLENISCISGSESEDDDDSLKSDGDISVLELEIMKMFDSNTEIMQKVNTGKLAQSNESPIRSVSLKSGSVCDASQTSLKQWFKSDHYEDNDVEDGLTKSPEIEPVKIDCIIVSKDASYGELCETIPSRQSLNTVSSLAVNVLDRFRLLKKYSSKNRSNFINFIDAMLLLLNFVLFLLDAVVLSLCIWLLAKHFNVNDIAEILGNNLIQVIIYASISGAGITILTFLCFCCFGIKHDQGKVGFYAVAHLTVVLAFTTAAVLSLVFSDKLSGVEFRINFRDRLVALYGDNVRKINQKIFTSAWDSMQEEFECCGAFGNENDTESWALYRTSHWFLEHSHKANVFVPKSCCRKKSNVLVCQGGDINLLGPPRFTPPLSTHYPQRNQNLNTDGCYKQFLVHTMLLSQCIATVTGCLALFSLLMAIFTWVFYLMKSKNIEENYTCNSSLLDEDIEDTEERTTENLLAEHSEIREPKNTKETVEKVLCDDAIKTICIDAADGYAYPAENSVQIENMEHSGASGNNTPNVNVCERTDCSDINIDIEEGGCSEKNTPREVIDRRTLWLTGGTAAGHILSLAIEEEDSDFLDSDAENSKIIVPVH